MVVPAFTITAAVPVAHQSEVQTKLPARWACSLRSRLGVRCRHPLTGGFVTCTGAFQFDSVIWIELAAL